jgi:hypothetical protein
MTQSLTIEQGTSGYVIKVNTLAEMDYLEEQGLAYSGVITAAMKATVESAEDASPFIYQNAVPDSTLMNVSRFSEEPILPTEYSPGLSGIISDDTDISIEI